MRVANSLESFPGFVQGAAMGTTEAVQTIWFWFESIHLGLLRDTAPRELVWLSAKTASFHFAEAEIAVILARVELFHRRGSNENALVVRFPNLPAA
jgi:hypothetical protein